MLARNYLWSHREMKRERAHTRKRINSKDMFLSRCNQCSFSTIELIHTSMAEIKWKHVMLYEEFMQHLMFFKFITLLKIITSIFDTLTYTNTTHTQTIKMFASMR